MAWICPRLCKLQKGCTRLATASDKVYQLLAHDQWNSPCTPASSTTKTGRHDIAEVKHQIIILNSNYSFVLEINLMGGGWRGNGI
jgi:hypothetical protein